MPYKASKGSLNRLNLPRLRGRQLFLERGPEHLGIAEHQICHLGGSYTPNALDPQTERGNGGHSRFRCTVS